MVVCPFSLPHLQCLSKVKIGPSSFQCSPPTMHPLSNTIVPNRRRPSVTSSVVLTYCMAIKKHEAVGADPDAGVKFVTLDICVQWRALCLWTGPPTPSPSKLSQPHAIFHSDLYMSSAPTTTAVYYLRGMLPTQGDGLSKAHSRKIVLCGFVCNEALRAVKMASK